MKGRPVFFVKMVNCLVITAIICVLVTTVGTIVSFATPNWLSVRVPAGVLNTRVDVCDCSSTDCDCGLWLNCRGGPSSAGSLNNCQWYFANEFAIEKNLPGNVQNLFLFEELLTSSIYIVLKNHLIDYCSSLKCKVLILFQLWLYPILLNSYMHRGLIVR